MTQQEIRFYKGIYKVTVERECERGVVVTAEEDIPLEIGITWKKGDQFVTTARLLHKQKKET